MAYSSIVKPSDYFNTKLYTGNGVGGTNITGVGFQPDLVWIKRRSGVENHVWNDAVRGVPKNIYSSSTNAQDSGSLMSAILSDGFTVQTDASVNSNNDTYASWNWKANGQGSSNTDGSTNTTYTSVNTTAGLSISTYAGSGSLATIGHGLGVAPKVVLIKSTSHTESWTMYHASLGAGKYIYLNNTDAAGGGGSNTSIFNNTAPTNSVFTVNTDGTVNGSGKNYIAYCFADVTGYSKFGSYTGNGNADGTFIYTGFKPAFIMTKNSVYTSNWVMKDNKRSGTSALQDFGQMNPNQTENPSANLNTEENKASAFAVDILSNGFKMRGVDNAGSNWDGNKYIYMAFAEEPFVTSTGIPTTAR